MKWNKEESGKEKNKQKTNRSYYQTWEEVQVNYQDNNNQSIMDKII